eukprot:SAG31_NODE_35291_length_324_cov_1.155556_1_plen_80_part_01
MYPDPGGWSGRSRPDPAPCTLAPGPGALALAAMILVVWACLMSWLAVESAGRIVCVSARGVPEMSCNCIQVLRAGDGGRA